MTPEPHFDPAALRHLLERCHDFKFGIVPPQGAQIVRKAVVNAEIERLNKMRLTVEDLQSASQTIRPAGA